MRNIFESEDKMDSIERIAEMLRSPERSLSLDMPADLHGDNPLRAQIAYDILQKASRDRSRLVRVQRNIIRNGKSVLTHLWVKPGEVKKTDVVLNQPEGTGQPYGGTQGTPYAKPGAQSSDNRKQKQGAASKQKQGTRRRLDPSLISQYTDPEPEETETPELPEPNDTCAEMENGAPVLAKNAGKKIGRVLHAVYQKAKLKLKDTLASSVSFQKAVCALCSLKNKIKGMAGAFQRALSDLIWQHNVGKYGLSFMEGIRDAYRNFQTQLGHTPEEMASAAAEWTRGAADGIRQMSLSPDHNGNPVNTQYADVLQDMIHTGGTVQTETIYRGVHVHPDFLAHALETGAFDANGLVSMADDKQSARTFALNADAGEIPVIIEMPAECRMRMLEAGTEDIIHTRGEFGVEKVTRDDGGVFHLELRLKDETSGGARADDAIYRTLGAAKPDELAREELDGTIGPDEFMDLLEQYEGSEEYYSASQIRHALGSVYHDYGYTRAVEFMTQYAHTQFNERDPWVRKFAASNTGFDPYLSALSHFEWINDGYSGIRAMEKEDLDETSSGADVYGKIASGVLNAMTITDGRPQTHNLYRGLCADHDLSEFASATIGSTVTLGALSSFSRSAKTGDSFSRETPDAQGPGVVLVLPKSARTQCLYTGGLQGTGQHEAESIVCDGKFRVIDRKDKKGRVYLTISPV